MQTLFFTKFQFVALSIVQHCRGRRPRRPEKTFAKPEKRDVQGAVPYELRYTNLYAKLEFKAVEFTHPQGWI